MTSWCRLVSITSCPDAPRRQCHYCMLSSVTNFYSYFFSGYVRFIRDWPRIPPSGVRPSAFQCRGFRFWPFSSAQLPTPLTSVLPVGFPSECSPGPGPLGREIRLLIRFRSAIHSTYGVLCSKIHSRAHHFPAAPVRPALTCRMKVLVARFVARPTSKLLCPEPCHARGGHSFPPREPPV